jgi:hypothetical protein
VQTIHSYLERKRREIGLLNRCLASRLDFPPPDSPAVAIEQKLQIAAALRAEQSLRSWAVTEIARPPTQRWHSGAFEFNFGYQRADLAVRGPVIYPSPSRQTTIYTGSGMSAIAALLMGVLQMHQSIEVSAASDCYSETRELMQSFGARLRIVTRGRAGSRSGDGASPRILWLDSCVRSAFFTSAATTLSPFDLIVVDTTCFGQGSGKIGHVVKRALAAGVPIALVRSHAKLDCLGIEYGRLGSIVIATGKDRFPAEPTAWAKRLAAHARDAVRLFGLAPIPVHFPPFAGGAEYRECNVARISSIIRNTRRSARIIAARLGSASDITTFQHGLYLTIAPRGDPGIDDVKRAAGELAGALAAQELCVKHAGSFGFDFVAVEWFPDPLRRRNVIRIAGADLPAELTGRIAESIATWWSANRRTRKATGGLRALPAEVTA